MIIGILGAMDCEIELLKNKMRIDKTVTIGKLEYFVGSIGIKNIVLARCGIGKVNASITTNTLINCFSCTHIVNTGVAGGLSNDISVFDIVLSTNVMHHDLDSDILSTNFPFTSVFNSDTTILKDLKDTYNALEGVTYKIFEGRIVSGEIFVSDDNLKKSLKENFAPHCVDMESSAVGHCCYAYDIPYICIRSISDKANDGAEMTFEEFAVIAANNSANLLIAYLSR